MTTSFYQVHWYKYPLLSWLNLIVDWACVEDGGMDVAYITEVDPLWADDELSFIINPEAVLFANPIAQAACGADCVAATFGFPLDPLFWCAGCQGSMYPLDGWVPGHNGGVTQAALEVERMTAKLHRQLLAPETSGAGAMCMTLPVPIIKKSQYKHQLVYPVPNTIPPACCNPYGRTSAAFEALKEFPYKGEDWVFLIWRKRNCCAF